MIFYCLNANTKTKSCAPKNFFVNLKTLIMRFDQIDIRLIQKYVPKGRIYPNDTLFKNKLYLNPADWAFCNFKIAELFFHR